MVGQACGDTCLRCGGNGQPPFFTNIIMELARLGDRIGKWMGAGETPPGRPKVQGTR